MTDARQRLGPLGVWGHLDSLGIDDLHAYGRRVEELGFGALWVPETVGREPFALLALLSTSTDRLVLGTSIASIYARDAVTARTAALTLHEASGRRFVLGLGVSHPHLVTKVRGHEYERPVSRMREYLTAYRAAPYRGPVLADESAGGSAQPDGNAGGSAHPDEPPIVLAALRPRMTQLSASMADGAFPYLVTPKRVAEMRGWLDAAAGSGAERPLLVVTVAAALVANGARSEGMGAARAWLSSYLRAPNYRASWSEQGFGEKDWESPGSDRLVEAMVAIGDAAAIRARVRAMHDAGADHVALIPLSPEGTTEHLPTVEALA